MPVWPCRCRAEMLRSGEDHAPSGILDGQLLLLGIDINFHFSLLYRGIVDIDPLWEFLFHLAFLILDANGIGGDGGNSQLSVSKGNGIG